MEKKLKKTPQQEQLEKEQRVADYQVARKENLVKKDQEKEESLKKQQESYNQSRINKEQMMEKDAEQVKALKAEVLNVLNKTKKIVSGATTYVKESGAIPDYQAPETMSEGEYEKLSQQGDPELGKLNKEIEEEDFIKERKRLEDIDKENAKPAERKKRRDARDEEIRIYRENEKTRLEKEKEPKVQDIAFGTGYELKALLAIPEFSKLDDGKRALVIEEIRQANVGRIRESAEAEAENNYAKLPWYKKVASTSASLLSMGIRKDYIKNKQEQEIAKKLQDNEYQIIAVDEVKSMADRIGALDIKVDFLTKNIDFMSNNMTDIEMEAKYPGMRSHIKQFNDAANLFINTKEPVHGIPFSKKEKEAYDSALSVYEFQKGELVKKMKEGLIKEKLDKSFDVSNLSDKEKNDIAIEAEFEAMLEMSEKDATVQMLNYTRKYPDAASILEDTAQKYYAQMKLVGLKSSLDGENQALRNFVAGMGVRSVRGLAVKALGGVGTTLGALALPAFVIAWRGYRGYEKGKQIINKEYRKADTKETFLESRENAFADKVRVVQQYEDLPLYKRLIPSALRTRYKEIIKEEDLKKVGEEFTKKNTEKNALEAQFEILRKVPDTASTLKERIEINEKLAKLKTELKEINEKINKGQRNVNPKNEKIDSFIDADSQIARIKYLADKIEEFEDLGISGNEQKIAQLFDTLSARINYIRSKNKENKINFGKDNPAGKHYALLETLGRAQAVLLSISMDPDTKDLYDTLQNQTIVKLQNNVVASNRNTWLARIQDANDKSFEKKRLDIKKWEVFKGAAFGIAGYQTMHLIMEGVSSTDIYQNVMSKTSKLLSHFSSGHKDEVEQAPAREKAIAPVKKPKIEKDVKPAKIDTTQTVTKPVVKDTTIIQKEEKLEVVKKEETTQAPKKEESEEEKVKIKKVKTQEEEIKKVKIKKPDIKLKDQVDQNTKIELESITPVQTPLDQKIELEPIDNTAHQVPEELEVEKIEPTPALSNQVPPEASLPIEKEEIKPEIKNTPFDDTQMVLERIHTETGEDINSSVDHTNDAPIKNSSELDTLNKKYEEGSHVLHEIAKRTSGETETYQQKLDREYAEENAKLPSFGDDKPIGPEPTPEILQKPSTEMLEKVNINSTQDVYRDIELNNPSPQTVEVIQSNVIKLGNDNISEHKLNNEHNETYVEDKNLSNTVKVSEPIVNKDIKSSFSSLSFLDKTFKQDFIDAVLQGGNLKNMPASFFSEGSRYELLDELHKNYPDIFNKLLSKGEIKEYKWNYPVGKITYSFDKWDKVFALKSEARDRISSFLSKPDQSEARDKILETLNSTKKETITEYIDRLEKLKHSYAPVRGKSK